MFFLTLTALCFFSSTHAKIYKENITDYSKCQVYYSRSGNVYKDFFELPEERHQNGTLLDFHFSVMASSDAHILFAPSSKVEKGDPAYEIVIGAGGNTFSDIRRRQKSAVKATVRIKGLLTALDVQNFWIHISNDGVLEVGKEGEELAFLTWTDPDPLPLKVFSFSTWPGVEAKWYFNCPLTANDTTNSTMIERPISDLERLRKDLLFFYNPYVLPVMNDSAKIQVGVQLITTTAVLDEHKSIFSYSGTVALSWQDEKLKWNISDYNQINKLHIFRREIWVPHLFLFNAADNDDILTDTMLIVNSTGFVFWTTTIDINSWCDPDDLGNWPRDIHTCDVALGFYRDIELLQLYFDTNTSTFTPVFSSTWQILQVETYSNVGWSNSSNLLDLPSLTLTFKIKRSLSFYHSAAFTPFIVIASSLLITFWASPFGYLKLSLVCFQIVLSVMVLLGLALIIPVHSKLVPNLVLLYSYSLVASVICAIIEIIVINLSRKKENPGMSNAIKSFLLSFPVKMILCIPDITTSDNYGHLREFRYKMKENEEAMWILLGITIDRLSFLVYLGFFGYALSVTY